MGWHYLFVAALQMALGQFITNFHHSQQDGKLLDGLKMGLVMLSEMVVY